MLYTEFVAVGAETVIVTITIIEEIKLRLIANSVRITLCYDFHIFI